MSQDTNRNYGNFTGADNHFRLKYGNIEKPSPTKECTKQRHDCVSCVKHLTGIPNIPMCKQICGK